MDSVIKFCAQYLIGVVALILVYSVFKTSKDKRMQLLTALVLAAIIAAILDKLAGKIYYDPRPFVTHNIKPLFPHGPDNGFPSDHTVLAMTLSSLLYFYRKKFALTAFILTLIVGTARVAAHVHSPIDIIGGLIIGAIAGTGGYYLAKQVLEKFSRKSKAS